MAVCRHVVVAESLWPSFRQRSQIPILCGLSFIHGKLWLETTGPLSEEYTSSCIVFNKSQRQIRTYGSELTNRAPFDKGLPARSWWPDSATVSDGEHFVPLSCFCSLVASLLSICNRLTRSANLAMIDDTL
jgi:hypothetical protein